MPSIYVKPRAGGRVRMPERNFQPMPEAGAWVPRHDYYERLLIGGDVVICDPPIEDEPTVEASPAPPPAAEEPAEPPRSKSRS